MATINMDRPHRIPRFHSRPQPLALQMPLNQHHHQQPNPHYTIKYLDPSASQPPYTCSTHPTPLLTRLPLPMPPPPPPQHSASLTILPVPAAASIDLYRKRKLAQRAQHNLTIHTTYTIINDNKRARSHSTTPPPPPLPLPLPALSDQYHTKPSKSINPPSSPTHRTQQRQKQLDLGYTTTAYQHYVTAVPLHSRCETLRESGHPVTPRKDQVCSKRSWDGQVRKWRRQLHEWDVGGRMYAQANSTAGTVAVDGSGGSGGDGGGESVVSGDVEQQYEDGLSVEDVDGIGDGDEEDEDVDEEDWRESIVRMAGALPD